IDHARAGTTVAGLLVRGRNGADLEVRARIVIAADGRSSRIARALRLSSYAAHPRRWAVGAYFDGVSELSSCGEMHIRRGHYIGVAPMADGRANACVVSSGGPWLRDPAALLRQAIGADVRLRG